MTAIVRAHAVGSAVAAAVGIALVWFVLAAATGLVFHFMPAGPAIVIAWTSRWADPRPRSRTERVALVVAGAAIALGMTTVLGRVGRPLDDGPVTGLAIAAGVVVGMWLLRRR